MRYLHIKFCQGDLDRCISRMVRQGPLIVFNGSVMIPHLAGVDCHLLAKFCRPLKVTPAGLFLSISQDSNSFFQISRFFMNLQQFNKIKIN